MNQLTVKINDQEVSVKAHEGQRVVTFKDVDQCHGRPDGTARKRFNDNKRHFIEGVDYFKMSASEIRTRFNPDLSKQAVEDIVLLTESGYMMLVKSFTDDLAWQVQRQLINTYFKINEVDSNALLKAQAQKERAEAMLLNAKIGALKVLKQFGLMGQALSSVSMQVLGLKAIQDVTGIDVGGNLPQCEKTYSATEIGQMLDISANKVGKLANANGLKAPEYGIEVLDKSRSSNKEVPNFRYYIRVVDRLKSILNY